MKKLSADPQNVVFALVRNPDNSPGLIEFVETNKLTNVHVIKLDLEDSASILVSLELVDESDPFVLGAYNMHAPVVSRRGRRFAVRREFRCAHQQRSIDDASFGLHEPH